MRQRPGWIAAEGALTIPVSDTLVLAVGHSARDTFSDASALRQLAYGIQGTFAVGVRIEHPQQDDRTGANTARRPVIPPWARPITSCMSRSPETGDVYTFCMCPGGQVVAAASEEGGVVTNGMSRFARDGENANSALLVGVDARDFGSDAPLAGAQFQRALEQKAFALGGGDYRAPCQLTGDFLRGAPSQSLEKWSRPTAPA